MTNYHKIFCARQCHVAPGEKYCDFIKNIEREVYAASKIPKDPEKYVNPHRPVTECEPLLSTYPEMAHERMLEETEQKSR